MMERDVYPQCWDQGPEQMEHLRANYATLRTFFDAVARNGNAALGCLTC